VFASKFQQSDDVAYVFRRIAERHRSGKPSAGFLEERGWGGSGKRLGIALVVLADAKFLPKLTNQGLSGNLAPIAMSPGDIPDSWILRRTKDGQSAPLKHT
jgi:hypothetical protein